MLDLNAVRTADHVEYKDYPVDGMVKFHVSITQKSKTFIYYINNDY